jgi:hypothetical protein
MRSRRLALKAAAMWLGMLALALNALVPIHLTFDLVAALNAEHGGPVHADDGSRERHFLAALTGHHHPHGKPGGHGDSRHTDCLVCNSLSALGGSFAPPLSAALLGPSLLAAVLAPLATSSTPSGASPAAYFSRAPPIS